MRSITKEMRKFLGDERGATAIEYAAIAGMVSVVFVAAATNIGTSLNDTFTSVKNGFPS
jgi:pilus assembly protein Flp/PilA